MHRRVLTLFPTTLTIAACGGSRAPEAVAPTGGTTAAITPADLERRSRIFADDSMLGRRAGPAGNVRGNAYIAAELGRLGLTPAGEKGTFLQPAPPPRRPPDPRNGPRPAR